jgi:DNA-directed RNA polymerase subunit M/transcription elongation factor TFIIS
MALPKLGVPKYFVTVPSTGQEIEYRPYTVREEKTLLLASEGKNEKQMVAAVRDLIEACTFGAVKGVDLPMFDFEYLFLKIRAVSVGESSEIGIKCSSCEAVNKVSIDLDTVEVQGEIKRNIKVKLTEDVGVIFKYPSVGAVEKSRKNKKANDYETTVELLISCIDTIYDAEDAYNAGEQSPSELRDFVESFSSNQFKTILENFQDMPAVKKEIEFSCSKCGEENNKTLEGLQSFF